jgi:hypothetical protein
MKTTLRLLALGALALTAITGCTGDSVQPTAAGSAYTPDDVVNVGQRPIADFIAGQGTWCMDNGSGECMLYAKPVANHIGFYDIDKRKLMMIDYATTTNSYLRDKAGRDFGTTFDGEIREEPTGDGRYRVTVHLRTQNALAYVLNGEDIMASPLFIGARPIDLMEMTPEAKAQVATGNLDMMITYINVAAGLPVPDLMQLVRAPQPGQQLLESQFTFKGTGINRITGQPTTFAITQNGPIMPSIPGQDPSTLPTAPASISFY